jgi:Tfp pilus assembly protein PilW
VHGDGGQPPAERQWSGERSDTAGLPGGSSWTETGVTWNNQPAPAGAAVNTASGTGWSEWSVASLVTEMYSGSNYGFVVRDETEDSATAQLQTFYSREGGIAPELVITFG